jgi:hypothetical protein
MITLALVERDGKGNPIGTTLVKDFESGHNAAAWYDRQRGHNIDRELDQSDKGVPPIRWKQAA